MAFVFPLCVLALSPPCKHILLYVKGTLNTCRSPQKQVSLQSPGFMCSQGTHSHAHIMKQEALKYRNAKMVMIADLREDVPAISLKRPNELCYQLKT